jgi:NTP pyrophosphatase (non-canonical NTP hydrolase)
MNFDTDLYRAKIARYGEKQAVVAMEECAELIQAISKSIRYENSGTYRENLKEEIADVLIMIETLKIMHEITDDEIQWYIDFKNERERKVEEVLIRLENEGGCLV